MSIDLSVNINKIALIRNSREGNNPDLIDYAQQCINFGANGITVHPRPDQRHIRAQDCLALKQLTDGQVEFNIEGNPYAKAMSSSRKDVADYPGLMALLSECRPAQATLVPDSDAQLTSDHGFDLSGDNAELADIIQEIQHFGCRVSLFMDPDCQQIEQAANIGADRVELYTGPYAWSDNLAESFIAYNRAAAFATSLGLGVNAGHDLNLDNLAVFSKLTGLLEVSIGHAITVDALQMGLEQTIQAYLSLLR